MMRFILSVIFVITMLSLGNAGILSKSIKLAENQSTDIPIQTFITKEIQENQVALDVMVSYFQKKGDNQVYAILEITNSEGDLINVGRMNFFINGESDSIQARFHLENKLRIFDTTKPVFLSIRVYSRPNRPSKAFIVFEDLKLTITGKI